MMYFRNRSVHRRQRVDLSNSSYYAICSISMPICSELSQVNWSRGQHRRTLTADDYSSSSFTDDAEMCTDGNCLSAGPLSCRVTA